MDLETKVFYRCLVSDDFAKLRDRLLRFIDYVDKCYLSDLEDISYLRKQNSLNFSDFDDLVKLLEAVEENKGWGGLVTYVGLNKVSLRETVLKIDFDFWEPVKA